MSRPRKKAWTKHQEPDDAVPQLSRLARYELYLRLKDPVQSAAIPMHVLGRLIGTLNNVEIDNKREGQQVGPTPQHHILEIVQNRGLPVDRQIQLLQIAIKERVEDGGDPADLQAALRELDGPLLLEPGGTNGHHEQP